MSKKSAKIEKKEQQQEIYTINDLSERYNISKNTVRSLIGRLGYDVKALPQQDGKIVVSKPIVSQMDLIHDSRKTERELAVAKEKIRGLNELVKQQKMTIETLQAVILKEGK